METLFHHWVLRVGVGLVGLASLNACAAFNQNHVPHASDSLPTQPVVIALGPVNAFEYDLPRTLYDIGAAPRLNVIDPPQAEPPRGTLRLRANNERKTLGASLMQIPGNQAQLSNTPLPAPSPLSSPSMPQTEPVSSGANQAAALCGGAAIMRHPNGGGLHAASLRVASGVFIPPSVVLCGSGSLSGDIQIDAQ